MICLRDKLTTQWKTRKESLRTCCRISSGNIAPFFPFFLWYWGGLPEGRKNARRDSRRLLQEAPTPKLTVESRDVLRRQLAV